MSNFEDSICSPCAMPTFNTGLTGRGREGSGVSLIYFRKVYAFGSDVK
jgi:hypothetical protein